MNPWVTDRFVFIFQDPPTPGVHLVETYGRYVYACMNYVYIYRFARGIEKCNAVCTSTDSTDCMIVVL